MIGYYVHHHGSGHLHRALAIAAELHDDVTILSSVARPAHWVGSWVDLALDTDIPAVDRDARGVLHFAPVGSRGLSGRMATISEWLDTARPDVVVVDVSVEVALLVRLHGVRVVVVAQAGNRTDSVHALGYQLADAIIGCWPPIVRPLDTDRSALERIDAIGGLSRFEVNSEPAPRSDEIVVLRGRGGRDGQVFDTALATARAALRDAPWTILESDDERQVRDALRRACFVISHCGQNAVAEIAAGRVPAVLVPEPRPFEEQDYLARALEQLHLPIRVAGEGVAIDWASTREEFAADNGQSWSVWVDGDAAGRAASIVERVAQSNSVAA